MLGLVRTGQVMMGLRHVSSG